MLEEWIGGVCRNIASATFQNYLHEDMTYEQAKTFCCEEILKNIGQFAQRNEVNADFYKKIDMVMEEKVMPYLALKYPLNQRANVNKNLNKIVKVIDNSKDLSNDFLYNSDIVWQYR